MKPRISLSKSRFTCLQVVLLAVALWMGHGALPAQVTYDFGIVPSQPMRLTPTRDLGFMCSYKISNTQFAYQQYDSTAAQQFGYALSGYNGTVVAQRYGKVFCGILQNTADSILFMKVNAATGVVERARRIGSSSSNYIANGDWTAIATQDSGLLVFPTSWASYSWTGNDVTYFKLDKNLSLQYLKSGGWPVAHNYYPNRVLRAHSDGTVWLAATLSNMPGDYALHIARIDPSNGAVVGSTTLTGLGPVGGMTEVGGNMVLTGEDTSATVSASVQWALSISSDLSQVHWLRRYEVPPSLIYHLPELNTGPRGLLYGRMGDKLICIRPTDGSVAWVRDVGYVTPMYPVGSRHMIATRGYGSVATLMDSLGMGFCQDTATQVTVTSLSHGTVSHPLNTYNFTGLASTLFPNPTLAPISTPTTVVCSHICDFTVGFTSSASQLTASFAAQPQGLESYHWSFGDGTTDTTQNPTHVFPSEGGYTVCLIGTTSCMSDTFCTEVTITCPVPTAAFSSSTSQLAATFTNASSGGLGPVTYSWTFGDGGTSTVPSPSHTYATAGNYTVCLVAQGPCGSDTSCQVLSVGCTTLGAAFSTSGLFPTVQFTDLSTGLPATWHWDFGDGGTASQPSPQHTYASPGSYTVCLIIADSCGSDTTCTPIDLSVGIPAAHQWILQLFPNPAATQVTLVLPPGASLTIHAADGRLQHSRVHTASTETLDVSTWPAGVYFVAMQVGGHRLVRRLCIQR